MFDTNFQKADKLMPADNIIKYLFLWMFPEWIHPNHITLARFITTPLVVALMHYEYYLVGLIAFLIVSGTDMIDGAMARTRNQITDWGRAYDPLADKILIGSVVFVIVMRYIDFWTAIIILFLEIVIIAIGWARKLAKHKIEANAWGKMKMISQCLGVVILLLAIVFDWAALIPLANGALYLAIAFAIVSLLTYSI